MYPPTLHFTDRFLPLTDTYYYSKYLFPADLEVLPASTCDLKVELFQVGYSLQNLHLTPFSALPFSLPRTGLYIFPRVPFF